MATVYCNFDVGTPCDFIQDTTDDFDWTIHQGRTSSGGTGPSTDMSGRGLFEHFNVRDLFTAKQTDMSGRGSFFYFNDRYLFTAKQTDMSVWKRFALAF